ncbi:hypothetical protein HK096_004516 [Nowakowskiella sp. JEL0078]|nr:hypothetical protein HK096_004516 [Nowakowskiella sp. JEL0078]
MITRDVRDFSCFKNELNSQILILLVAAVGSGKTTTALYLHHLFNFTHIQSDDVGKAFKKNVVNAFKTSNVVIADRNNHLKKHRREICEAVKMKSPDISIVAVDWNISNSDLPTLISRINKRGENHQTLITSMNFTNVVKNFVTNRDALNVSEPDDELIDYVIDLSVENSTLKNISLISEKLKFIFSESDFEKASEKVSAYVATTKKQIINKKSKKMLSDEKLGISLTLSTDKTQFPKFYGIRIVSPITPFLSPDPILTDSQTMSLFTSICNTLTLNKRIQPEFHITLVRSGPESKNAQEPFDIFEVRGLGPAEDSMIQELYIPELAQFTDLTNESLLNYYSRILNRLETKQGRIREGRCSVGDGIVVDIYVGSIVFNSDLIVLKVTRMSPRDCGVDMNGTLGRVSLKIGCTNKFAHITIGTRNESIKPFQSNSVLEQLEAGADMNNGPWEIKLQEIKLKGFLTSFWY